MNTSLMPRGKDKFGNETVMFGKNQIRADYSHGDRPLLALVDVLDVCGMSRKTPRKQLNINGVYFISHFLTPKGVKRTRVIELDDAHRIAMQGCSEECCRFRDFLVDVLRRIESGDPINAAPVAPPSTPLITTPHNSGFLVQQAALLHNIALAIEEQERRQAATEKKVEAVAAQVARIEGDKIDAEVAMKSLPAPKVDAPPKSEIDDTALRIQWWVKAKGGGGEAYSAAYMRLYDEIRIRLHFDARKRFIKGVHGSVLNVLRSEKPEKITFADFHAAIYAIACEIFPIEPRIAL